MWFTRYPSYIVHPLWRNHLLLLLILAGMCCSFALTLYLCLYLIELIVIDYINLCTPYVWWNDYEAKMVFVDYEI